jgi:hypothetical protein
MADNGLAALLAEFDGSVCPACHHVAHDPGSCEECPRCELHTDEALAFVLRIEPGLLPDQAPANATLRDTLDGLVEATQWHLDNPNHPNEGHQRLRAALAAAKGTP